MKLMGWQDLLTIIQFAWDDIEEDAVRSAFQAAGLGLRLDGQEDDLVWSGNEDYEAKLKEQRRKTLAH